MHACDAKIERVHRIMLQPSLAVQLAAECVAHEWLCVCVCAGDVHAMFRVLASLEHVDRSLPPTDVEHDEPEQQQLADIMDRRAR